jgi:hypothetical protein
MPHLTSTIGAALHDDISAGAAEPNERFGKYCYMFEDLAKAEVGTVPFGGSESDYFGHLDSLRKTMEEFAGQRDVLSKVPAAYTYFGQFLNHDISAPVRVTTVSNPARRIIEADPDLDVLLSPVRARSINVHLDLLRNEHARPMTLNSLYGGGPSDAASSSLYASDKVRFLLADAFDDPAMLPQHRARLDLNGKSKFDLPRDGAAKVALIADRRNDQNLAISQLHLAFMLFHNRVADDVARKFPRSGEKFQFEEARRIVTRHYQWCIVHDYLDRTGTSSHGSFQGIVPGAKRRFANKLNKPNTVPLEFTTAAFRFGHSMVGAFYDYNEVFSKDGVRPAQLLELFMFTSSKGMLNQVPPPGRSPQVPFHWIINWNMFLKDPPEGSAAESINPRLAGTMLGLQEKMDDSKMRQGLQSICARNLRRGYHRFIPSGQKLANALGLPGLDSNELLQGFGRAQMLSSGTLERFEQLITAGQFGSAMPAWAYFLCEAQNANSGKALGPVAGAIVRETILGLLKLNKSPVIGTEQEPPKWNPADNSSLRTSEGKPVDSLRRILEFAEVVAPANVA